jgi:type II secretory pathway component PulF
MEMALHSGIPIITALDMSIPIISEEVMVIGLESAKKGLESGRQLSECLKESGQFPPFVFNLIGVGEESGKIEEGLSNIAKSFEDDCEENIRTVTALIEPVMVLIIGLVVAFIVSAIFLPIFELDVIKL